MDENKFRELLDELKSLEDDWYDPDGTLDSEEFAYKVFAIRRSLLGLL